MTPCGCGHREGTSPFTLMDWVSNVDGSMLGKSFTTTGSRNSMKGTTMKTRKGTRRKRSAQMRRNCKERQGQGSRSTSCSDLWNSRAVPLGRACRRAGWAQHPALGPPGPAPEALTRDPGVLLWGNSCGKHSAAHRRAWPDESNHEDGSLLGRLWPHHPPARPCISLVLPERAGFRTELHGDR